MGIPESVKKRLKQLEEHLIRLEEMQGRGRKAFFTQWEVQDVVLRNFQVAIEICLDIGTYLISQKRWNPPANYVEVFNILQERGVIPHKMAEEFKKLTRFRNIIVHEYLYLDSEKIYANLQRVSLFRDYAKSLTEVFLPNHPRK